MANEEYQYQRAIDLTKNLTDKQDRFLMIFVPMSVGADSTDIEMWLTEIYTGGEINKENINEVAENFRKWYMEGK